MDRKELPSPTTAQANDAGGVVNDIGNINEENKTTKQSKRQVHALGENRTQPTPMASRDFAWRSREKKVRENVKNERTQKRTNKQQTNERTNKYSNAPRLAFCCTDRA